MLQSLLVACLLAYIACALVLCYRQHRRDEPDGAGLCAWLTADKETCEWIVVILRKWE